MTPLLSYTYRLRDVKRFTGACLGRLEYKLLGEKPSPTASIAWQRLPIRARGGRIYTPLSFRGIILENFQLVPLMLAHLLFYTFYIDLHHHHHFNPLSQPLVSSSLRLAEELTFQAITWEHCLAANSSVLAVSPFDCSAMFVQVFNIFLHFDLIIL